jgi:tRNA1Val (adenine37-N6)-methyltransferase
MNELLKYIHVNLEADGSFYLLLPAKRIDEIENMIGDEKFFIPKKIIVKQSTQHLPFRIMIKGGFEKKETITSELSITDASKNYTSEFIELLKDYYLHL